MIHGLVHLLTLVSKDARKSRILESKKNIKEGGD